MKLFALALVLLLLVPMQQAGVDIPVIVTTLIPFAVGWIAVPIINFVKTQIGWVDPIKNLWLAVALSIILALLLLFLSNVFIPTPDEPLAYTVTRWIGITFATATVIYKRIQTGEPNGQTG